MPVMVPGSGVSFSPLETGSGMDWEGKRALQAPQSSLEKLQEALEKYLPSISTSTSHGLMPPVYSQGNTISGKSEADLD